MEKFMTASASPNPATTAASPQARSVTMPRTAMIAGRAPSPMSTALATHSRRPVSPAAGTVPNMRAARPAPICTLRIPAPSSAGAGILLSTSRCGAASGRRGGDISGKLFPAEGARRDADADDRPYRQHEQVLARYSGAVTQYGSQSVRHETCRQQQQRWAGRGGQLGGRQHHPADAEQYQVDQVG